MLPDVPETRRLLDDLQHGRPLGPLSSSAARILERLAHADALVPDRPGRSPAGPPGGLSVGLSGPRTLIDAAAGPLRATGLHLDAIDRTDGARDAGDAVDEVQVLLAHGALSRTLLDALVRDGIPHVVAVATVWGWELGPFVVPGETACLRCVDAAHADHDPRYGVVVDQLSRATAPFATDPVLDAVALGWLARDLLAYARGQQPTTWSATVRLADGRGDDAAGRTATQFVEERRWLRHPHCGCAWDALTG